jgi:L-serine dehydratase
LIGCHRESQGPVITTVDGYKVGLGRLRRTIDRADTYDFYQRCSKLPTAQLDQATGLSESFGSPSATGRDMEPTRVIG